MTLDLGGCKPRTPLALVCSNCPSSLKPRAQPPQSCSGPPPAWRQARCGVGTAPSLTPSEDKAMAPLAAVLSASVVTGTQVGQRWGLSTALCLPMASGAPPCSSLPRTRPAPGYGGKWPQPSYRLQVGTGSSLGQIQWPVCECFQQIHRVHVRAHTSAHTHAHTSAHTRTSAHTHAHTSTHTHTHTRTHAHTLCILFPCLSVHTINFY